MAPDMGIEPALIANDSQVARRSEAMCSAGNIAQACDGCDGCDAFSNCALYPEKTYSSLVTRHEFKNIHFPKSKSIRKMRHKRHKRHKRYGPGQYETRNPVT